MTRQRLDSSLPVEQQINQVLHRREPHTVLQLVLGAIGFFVAMLIGGIIAGAIHAAFIGPGSELPEGVFLWSQVLASLLTIPLFFTVVVPLSRRIPVELWGPGSLRELGLGLALGAGMMAVIVGIIWLAGGYHPTGVGMTDSMWFGVAAGIGGGFGEEILFRGFILRIVERWVGSWPALLISSALFGAVHLSNENATAFGAAAIGVEAGVLFAALYLWTRRLWVPIGLHIAWNFTQGAVFSSPISGLEQQDGFIRATFSGPELLTGGAMGVEGSVVAIVVCLAVAAVALWRAHQAGRIMNRPTNFGRARA